MELFWKLSLVNMGVSKNRGGPPKWMVKIMENPMNDWMIWGKSPYFWRATHMTNEKDQISYFLMANVLSFSLPAKKNKFCHQQDGPVVVNIS